MAGALASGAVGPRPCARLRGLLPATAGSQVLFGIDLQVEAGEVVGLLGRNGMGKTTLIRSICGLAPARSGAVVFGGSAVASGCPHRIARRGLGLVPEGRQIFPNLTVVEHLAPSPPAATVRQRRWTPARVYRLCSRALPSAATNMGNQLSGGEQQMLAIGRALVTNPRLLILDEATEGLAPLVREEIWRCLAALRVDGQAILVIDKYVQRLIELADRHVILEKGRVAWSGSSAELDAAPAIWQRHLGV